MALVTTFVGLARFAASLLFGWLWMRGGVELAVGTVAGALLVAVILSVFLLGWARERGSFDDDGSPC
jgi:hypothetical protein